MTNITLRTLGLLSASAIALVGCSDSTSPANVTPDAPAINELIATAPKFGEAAEHHDSVVKKVDTLSTSRIDSINHLVYNTTWRERTIHVSAADNPDQFMMYDPNASVLWPGNLVQGRSVTTGVPQSVPVADRAPANVFLAVVSGDSSGTSNKLFRRVERPSGSSITQALNEILAGYKGAAPAKYNYTQENVYSADQINFTLGFGYSGPSVEASGYFGFARATAKSRIAVKLTQQYFTMAFDDPQGAAGVFGSSVTTRDLEPYVGPGNPLCYISSVTYGRVFILIYESDASRDSLAQALQFAYSGGVTTGSFNDTLNFSSVMAKSQVRVFQIGGDAASGLLLSDAKNLKNITDFLSGGANFSPSNVGAPISFTVKYLKDASLVRMSSTMEYDYIERTPIDSSSTPTTSKFDIALDRVFIPSSSDPNGGDGGVGMAVGITIEATGKDSVIWAGPHNHPDALWDLGQDAMKTGASFPLNWTVPTFYVPDASGRRIFLEFYGNEFDNEMACQDGKPCGIRYWKTARIIIDFVGGQQVWQKANASQSLKELTLYDVGNDTNIRFDFQVKRNDGRMQ